MKKMVVGILLGTLLLVGCGEQKNDGTVKSENTSTSSSVKAVLTATKKVTDKFAGQAEMGAGTFDLVHTSGRTSEGKEIIVFYDPDTFPTSVGISTRDIEGSHLSYLYADGQLLEKKQLGDTESDVQLQDVKSAIATGTHTLQLVQYDTDKEEGKIVTFKQQSYTVKEK